GPQLLVQAVDAVFLGKLVAEVEVHVGAGLRERCDGLGHVGVRLERLAPGIAEERQLHATTRSGLCARQRSNISPNAASTRRVKPASSQIGPLSKAGRTLSRNWSSRGRSPISASAVSTNASGLVVAS